MFSGVVGTSVWTLNSDFFLNAVNRKVKSVIDEILQLLHPDLNTDQDYVLKLCDSEEYLHK